MTNIFEIDESFLTDIPLCKEWGLFDHIPQEELTHDQLIKILKGEDRCSMHGVEDHPKFTKLREQLGEEGFIKIERGWYNGDRVLKPFYLNGFLFKKGHKFCCAPALKNAMEVAKKYNRKTLI